MRNLEQWESIEGLGTFDLEMELVVSTEPVLFVCKKKEERYLFMTYNSYDGVFVFCKISTDDLLRMLNNEITMENAFRLADNIYQTYVTDDGIMRFEQYTSSSFDGNRLPKKEAYYRIHSSYIQKYIEELVQETTLYVPYDCSVTADLTNWKFDCTIEVQSDLSEKESCNNIVGVVVEFMVENVFETHENFVPEFIEAFETLDLLEDEDTINDIIKNLAA